MDEVSKFPFTTGTYFKDHFFYSASWSLIFIVYPKEFATTPISILYFTKKITVFLRIHGSDWQPWSRMSSSVSADTRLFSCQGSVFLIWKVRFTKPWLFYHKSSNHPIQLYHHEYPWEYSALHMNWTLISWFYYFVVLILFLTPNPYIFQTDKLILLCVDAYFGRTVISTYE